MPINKLADKEVNGLFRRQGKRGDTWIYARFKNGKMERGSLGSCEVYTVEEARRWAYLKNTSAAGKTPEYTLGEVLDMLTKGATLRGLRHPDYTQAAFNVYAPDWLKLPLPKITRVMVRERHDKIAYTKVKCAGRSKGGPMAARHFVKAIRAAYTFADEQLEYEGRSPAKGIKVAPQKPRQVIWTEAELAKFLEVCKADSEYWFNFFTVLVETGMRRGNVEAMEWGEVNLEAGIWTIPETKFKTKVIHVAHLTPEAVKAIEGQRGLSSQWVFPAMIKPDAPMSTPYYKFNALCKKAGVKGKTPHDIRRTLGSRLAAKVPMQVIAKILGHKEIGTTMAHYAVIDDTTARQALMSL